jgi:hypothetical protein
MSVFAKPKAAIRVLTGRVIAHRTLPIHDDDIFLASYPKSGNTYVRFLLATLVYPDQCTSLLAADRLVPDVDGQTRRYFRQMPRPRIIKTHYPFDHTYKRVVYIVRDPRDVVLSQYHYQIKRKVLDEGYPLEAYVPRFVAGDVSNYGSWRQHVGSWLGAYPGNDPAFRLVRYEDLLHQTSAELGRIARFLHIESTPDQLAQAVERSTADQMRKLEEAESAKWGSTKGTRKDKPYFRAATDKQWVTALPSDCIAQIERAWGGLMASLGYQTVSGQYAPDAALSAVLSRHKD